MSCLSCAHCLLHGNWIEVLINQIVFEEPLISENKKAAGKRVESVYIFQKTHREVGMTSNPGTGHSSKDDLQAHRKD